MQVFFLYTLILLNIYITERSRAALGSLLLNKIPSIDVTPKIITRYITSVDIDIWSVVSARDFQIKLVN